MSGLLHEVLAYCRRTETPESLFGRKTIGDSAIVAEMRRGRNPTERTCLRIRAMMAKHPEGFEPGRTVPPRNRNTLVDNRAHWEVVADTRQGSEQLRDATIAIAPASAPTRRLSHEEQIALILSGKARTYTRPNLSRSYDYSLTGGSM